MVKFIAIVMLCTAMIDLIIALVWIGLIGWIELRDTYNKAYPETKISDLIMSLFKKEKHECIKDNKEGV